MRTHEKIFWVIISALTTMLAIYNAGIAYISNETFFCFGGWCIASLTSMLYMIRLTQIKNERK